MVGGGVAFVTRKGRNGIEALVEVLAGAGGGMLGAKRVDLIYAQFAVQTFINFDFLN